MSFFRHTLWHGLFAAVAAIGLSGCCMLAYIDDACNLPEESSACGCNYGRRVNWPRSCMNMTANDFKTIWGFMDESLIGGCLIAPFILPDVPFSLCADLVSMPWQLSRYKDFPEDSAIDSLLGRPAYRGAPVPEVLRVLRSRQAADGRWTGGKSVLADTALVALALTYRGEHRKAVDSFDGDEYFMPVLSAAMDWLERNADTSSGTVRFFGEEADPRAFPIAAASVVAIWAETRSPAFRPLAQKCLERAASELVRDQNADLDTLTAERLGWLVLALASGQAEGWKGNVDGLDSALGAVRDRLAGCASLKGSYYDTCRLFGAVVRGEPGAQALFSERQKENWVWISNNITGGQRVRGADGKYHWMASLGRKASTAGYRGSGLGRTADDALGVLQVSFPVSIVPSAKPEGASK